MKTNINRVLVTTGIAALLVAASSYTVKAETAGSCGANCEESASCKAKIAETADISTTVLQTLLAAKVPVAVFDARSGKYDDGKRIPGAASLSAEATVDDVTKAIKDKDSLVVTYCVNTKCPASVHLAAHLRELGYKNVLEYRAGIEGWIAAGNSVEETAKK